MSAPFRVEKRHGQWIIRSHVWNFAICGFGSQAEAIDHVYRNWPWWP